MVQKSLTSNNPRFPGTGLKRDSSGRSRLTFAILGYLVFVFAAVIGVTLIDARPANAKGNPQATWAQAADAPEFARQGEYRVGTISSSIPVPARPSISAQAQLDANHKLPIRIFFPSAGGGHPAVYRHTVSIPRTAPYNWVERGLAFEGAAPLAAGSFPLVVVSHGLGGWSTHFSRLSELIASHGYIVVSLDHQDAPFEDVPAFVRSFDQVLAARPLDQRTAIDALLSSSYPRVGPLRLIDPSKQIGLVGYSMGGYGAIATAGANYDVGSPQFARLSEASRHHLSRRSQTASRIGALILMAPWGSQPESRVWNLEALNGITAPTLLICGDRDKGVNYQDGVRWIFDNMRGSDRRLLSLQGAGHGIAGNYVDLPGSAPPAWIDAFKDPIWRQERLNQANAHFVIAFLNETLKADPRASAYLNVPTTQSDQGAWPIAFGQDVTGRFASDSEPSHWRGFQRGLAAGMALERKAKGE